MTSARRQTAEQYISHFATLDSNLLSSVLATDHTHIFTPASLKPPGPFNKDEFIAHGGRLHEIMTGFPVTIKSLVESESDSAVTVWATSKPIWKPEVLQGAQEAGEKDEDWEYGGEYVFMFWMDASGEKIVKTVEFLDSLATERLRELMTKARKFAGSRESKKNEW